MAWPVEQRTAPPGDGNIYSGAATQSSWVVMRQMLPADVVPGRAAILVTRLTYGRTKATARLSPHGSAQIRNPLVGTITPPK